MGVKTKKGRKLEHSFLSLAPKLYSLVAHIPSLTGGNTIAQPVALRSIEPSLGGETGGRRRQQTVFPIVSTAHAPPTPSDTEQLLSH